MNVGSHTLCLKTKNLEKSREFYEALGMKVYIDEQQHVNLDSGTTNISLMSFLEDNCLNFRGGDVQDIHRRLKSLGFDLEGKPFSYDDSPGGAGTSWLTRDPDGNVVFFDTNESDSAEHRVARLLTRIEYELTDMNLISDAFSGFKQELMEKVRDQT